MRPFPRVARARDACARSVTARPHTFPANNSLLVDFVLLQKLELTCVYCRPLIRILTYYVKRSQKLVQYLISIRERTIQTRILYCTVCTNCNLHISMNAIDEKMSGSATRTLYYANIFYFNWRKISSTWHNYEFIRNVHTYFTRTFFKELDNLI